MSDNFSIAGHKLAKKAGGRYKLDKTKYRGDANKISPFKANALQYLIIHYTAGGSAASSAKHLADPSVKACAHLVIERDGSVFQLVDFDQQTWHAGESQYDGKRYLNQYSIGIELANAGVVTPSGSGFVSWFGKWYSENEVIKAVHRNESSPKHWHSFTEEQIQSCFEISKLLTDTYNLKAILGHEEISPGRKVDPGPAFPLDRMRETIFGGGRERDQNSAVSAAVGKKGEVMASKLNIRTTPSTQAEKLMNPLPQGKAVEILEERGDWYRVSVESEGWVSKKYIDVK